MLTWNFLSTIVIFSFILLQAVRWVLLPQFMDIYYHLLTAQGFIQAGGYSGWDFWQYAPVGRVHIYPPFFHLILSGFIKLGIDQVVLAKLCEVLIPCLLLFVTWNFVRKFYSQRLAFFVVLAFFTSNSFYLSLVNHLPATLALIFGILSLGQLFKSKLLRSAILLVLSFYTHIGISFFLFLVFIIYGLANKDNRRGVFKSLGLALILSSPVLIKDIVSLKYISTFGFNLIEVGNCQIKILELILSILGVILAFKRRNKYSLFLSLFFANLIFLIYPYRFFSGEGYFTTLIFFAIFLDFLYSYLNKKLLFALICVFVLLISPTLIMSKTGEKAKSSVSIKFFDSAFFNMLFVKVETLWYPNEYLWAVKLVKENSTNRDAVFSTIDLTGVTISSLSGRLSANALLPEVMPSKAFNPLLTSKIIIFTIMDDPLVVKSIEQALRLVKIGENRFFIVYNNPNCQARSDIPKAGIGFKPIIVSALILGLLYIFIKNI